MTTDVHFYRFWWAGVLGVMAACLSLAVADLPLYSGAPVTLSLFGGVAAAAGFLAPRLLEGVQGWSRRILDLVLPFALVMTLALTGIALPSAAVPVAWAVPLAFLSWVAAGAVATDLARMDRTSDGEVVAACVSRLGSSFLLGLILLFLLLAIGSGRLADVVAGLYVLTGVGTFGWLQYSARKRRWAQGGAQVRGRLGRHWFFSALASVAVVAILAALTPTDLLLAVANTVWHAVGPALAQPVVSILGQTDTHYQRYQGGGFGGVHHYGGGGGRASTHPYHGHGVGSVGSGAEFLLWIPAAMVLAYLGRAYWRHRLHGVPWRVALLGPLLAAWQRLRFVLARSLDVANAYLPDQLAVLLPGAGMGAPGRSRRRLGQLSARERVGLYFLGVLRVARRRGIPCPPWITPREFVPVLGSKVGGDAHGKFADLTDAFMEARYSLHEISDTQADDARVDARRVRAALRDVREPGPPTSPASV